MSRKTLNLCALAALCLSGMLLALYLRQSGGEVSPVTTDAAVSSPVHTTATRLAPSTPMTLLSTRAGAARGIPKLPPSLLTNTSLSASRLAQRPHALILANALLDTSRPLNLNIPDSLRAPPDNGTYIVQARGMVDAAFRAQLAGVGAVFAAYVPNDAWLVRMSEAGARTLSNQGLLVLPYEPYFKVDASLLPLALGQKAEAASVTVKVLVFADQSATAAQTLTQAGVTVGRVESSPFGPVYTVQTAPEQLAMLARLPLVQSVEPARTRQAANDLTRVRLQAASDPATNATYQGLTGTNVMVAVAESGVDFGHPDLINRLSLNSDFPRQDTLGHGTFVMGTILGSGAMSGTVSNAQGSVTNASFRGLAPAARGLFLSTDPAVNSDADLQERAVLGGARLSNDSWNYTNAQAYDLSAASYDAAVRDALPAVSGSQPVLFVFSAGNAGGGDPGGFNGNAQTIESPGTAKNVITVGALEQFRNITNNLVIGTATNQPYLPQTDSSNQVASFSSRGNVGIGIEGDFGRFKPDVVAPGTFVVSDRSRQWNTSAYYNPTNFHDEKYSGVNILTNTLKPLSVFIPDNTIGLVISISANTASPFPLPDLPVFARYSGNPTFTTYDLVGTNSLSLPPAHDVTLLRGTTLFFSVGNTWTQAVNVNITATLATTNDSPELQTLAAANADLAPYYRYESGTSMAAAAVTGWLVLVQEFFEQRLHQTNSPALMKALLINGARPVNVALYDLSPQNPLNPAGWGLPQLSNSVPGSLTNRITDPNSTNVSLQYFDQNPATALATGQQQTRNVSLSPGGRRQPLRVTLVWTDPPGNPVAGIKLVNDLDLIVTNLDTGDVFWGNDIPAGATFNEAWDTNNAAPADFVNNVENVYLNGSPQSPLGTNYSVTVSARRVNVNAVTVNTNNVVQDYALVISSGDGDTLTNAFAVAAPAAIVSSNNASGLTLLTNGVPIFNQRVGGNAPYSGTTNGYTNQWNFYVYTNTTTNLNVALVTFFPPEVGVTRIGTRQAANPGNAGRVEGDVDLFVSTNPALTNLDPVVLATADRSVTRTGTEKVLYTNSTQGQVYYVAIKSEDQEGAQYAFAGVASQLSFGQLNPNGDIVLTVLGSFPVQIPDGSPDLPGATQILALTVEPGAARRVVVTNDITHQNFGDIVGTLSHGQNQAVLDNHTPFDNGFGREVFVYDDSGQGDIPGARHTDGPGSLRNFTGDKAADGLWIVTMVDDALSHTGQVNGLSITVQPEQATNGSVSATLSGFTAYFDYIDVPAAATNLAINVGITAGAGPVELFVRRGAYPTDTVYDKALLNITPPGAGLTISKYESPPLNPGRYFIEVTNPNPASVTVVISKTLGLDLNGAGVLRFLSKGNEPIPDDAVMYSTNTVGMVSRVVAAEVGVRIDHPRVSDLALTLISPSGTRVLLAENRGGLSTNGYGSGVNFTNVFPAQTSGGAAADTNDINVGLSQGTVVINYDFESIPDDLRIYYGGARIFDTGLVSGAGSVSVDFGPGAATDVQIVMNEGNNANTGTFWTYTATVITRGITYAVFSENTNFAQIPIKFANPPFGTNTGGLPATNVMTSSFEVPAGSNAFPAIVDGWSVLDTNTVQVVNVPVLANTGTNVLALHNGSLSRVLPTVAGRTYTLTFVNHGRPVIVPTSWWKGEGNGNDSADGNNGTSINGAGTSPGEVGNAFNFNGMNQYFQVANSPNLNPTGSFAIEAWIYYYNGSLQQDILDKWDFPDGPGDLRQYVFGITPNNALQFAATDLTHENDMAFHVFHTPDNVLKPNFWNHVAGVFNQGTGTRMTYVNGALVASRTDGPFNIVNSTTLVGIGADNHRLPQPPVTPFNGLIDELSWYLTTLSPLQLQDIYAAGSAGKMPVLGPMPVVSSQITLAGVTNYTISGIDSWTTNSLTFTAPSNGLTLQVQSLTDGMLFDSFVLTQQPLANPPLYYLPEESLSKVIGENSAGDWVLEVLDNRAGATNPPPMLVSWQLSLTLESTVPFAIPLVHAVPVTNSVAANSITYFSVDVPAWAGFATNILSNATGPVSLLFNQNFLPGTNAADVTLLLPTTSGTATLATNGLPPPFLQPGNRYYLGVQNNGATPVNFTLEVDFNITTLTNALPLTNSLAPAGQPRYYQFDVDTNAVAAAFEILETDGNVDLVVSRAPTLPTLSQFTYVSANPGSNTEAIVILTNSTPVPLAPGRWYAGVFNRDTKTVNYIIRATETGPPNIIVLTNGIGFSYQSPPGVALTNFFEFTVSGTNAAVLFELYNLTGNADLLAQRDSLPISQSYFAGSFNPGTLGEQIVLRTNLLGTNLNANWYLAVPNNEITNVAYTIRAVVSTNGILPSGVPIGIIATPPATGSPTGPTLTWPAVAGEKYEVEYSTNLVTWTVLAIITAGGPTATFTDPTPPGSLPAFYRIIQVP